MVTWYYNILALYPLYHVACVEILQCCINESVLESLRSRIVSLLCSFLVACVRAGCSYDGPVKYAFYR